ncbi:hypothetical protein ACSCCQ_004197, partial [Escherichia coli]
LCRIPEDPHHWNGFSGEKRILYGHSAHHFFFSSSTIHVSLPRLITDYEVQKYLSFQLPVIRYRERFCNTWSNTGCIQVAEKGARKPNGL